MNDNESNRFTDPAVWLVVFVFGLLLYVFAYPVILAMLHPIAPRGEKLLRISALPLTWLVHNFPAYETYIRFLHRLILR